MSARQDPILFSNERTKHGAEIRGLKFLRSQKVVLFSFCWFLIRLIKCYMQVWCQTNRHSLGNKIKKRSGQDHKNLKSYGKIKLGFLKAPPCIFIRKSVLYKNVKLWTRMFTMANEGSSHVCSFWWGFPGLVLILWV